MRVKFNHYIRFCKIAIFSGGIKITFIDLDSDKYTVYFNSKEQALSFHNKLLENGYIDLSDFRVRMD